MVSSLPDAGQHARRAPGVPPRHLPTELSGRLQSCIARRMLTSQLKVKEASAWPQFSFEAWVQHKQNQSYFPCPCRPQKCGGFAPAVYIHFSSCRKEVLRCNDWWWQSILLWCKAFAPILWPTTRHFIHHVKIETKGKCILTLTSCRSFGI